MKRLMHKWFGIHFWSKKIFKDTPVRFEWWRRCKVCGIFECETQYK